MKIKINYRVILMELTKLLLKTLVKNRIRIGIVLLLVTTIYAISVTMRIDLHIDQKETLRDEYPLKDGVRLEATLIDVQTASIGISFLNGEAKTSFASALVLWLGNQPGRWADRLAVKTIATNQPGQMLFKGLNINTNLNYTIGLILGDTTNMSEVPNVAATLFIPAGICPPQALESRKSSVEIKARFVNSLLVQYNTPLVNKGSSQWLAVFKRGISRLPFQYSDMLSTMKIPDHANRGTVELKQLDLDRLSTYTVLYGTGFIGPKQKPNLSMTLAAVSFQTD